MAIISVYQYMLILHSHELYLYITTFTEQKDECNTVVYDEYKKNCTKNWIDVPISSVYQL